MRRRAYLSGVALAVLSPIGAVAAAGTAGPPLMSAAQVVEKNIAVRGGLEAWRNVQAISFSGKMNAGGKQNPELPFWMELKRPHRTRIEIEFAKDKALQVYDGVNGWRLRPFLGRKEVEAFNAEQLKSASMESELDGFLVDYVKKGTTVKLDGLDKVEGRDAYKLELTLKGGAIRHLWIDAETFLEARLEGVPRRMDGKLRAVEVYYRDFKAVNGLMVPYVLETVVAGSKRTQKTTIEQVVVNPTLDDSRFTRASLDASASQWKYSAATSAPTPGTGESSRTRKLD